MNTTIINALVKGLGKKSVILTAILIVSGFFVASFALAAEGVAISPATGGENVSIDTTFPGGTGDYTTLDSFSITESVPGQITQGVHTISLPSGWEFNMASTITIFRTDAIVLASYNITPDQTSFSFTVNSISTSNSTLFFNGLQVRPTTQHPNTSNGNITHSGADIIGVTNGSTSFGTLSTVAGTVTKLAFTTQPGSAEYGSNLSPQPVVKTQDQFGNDSTSGLAANLDVTLTKTSGTGVLTGTNVLDIGTGVGNGIATFTNLTVDEFGTGKQLTASAGGLAPAISTDFEITQAPLTITAEGKTKVYGTANPGLTAAYSGFVNGETSTVLTSPVILSVPADATSPVGPYVITASGATATNYSIIFVPGTLTITQAPLTITADAQTKIYGGTDPALTYQITSGALVNGDILTGSLSRVAGENVGTRAIEQGDLDNSNYDISFVSADLTITTKPITVTAVTNTKTYNGNMDAIATPTFPEGSLVGSDTANFIEAYDTKNVGTEKTLTPSGIVNDGNGGNNYSYNFVTDITGVINQAPLTITAEGKTKVYGTANPELTVSYSGFVGGDTSAVVSDLSVVTLADTTTPVGTSAITPSGATATNYSISFVPGVLTITPAPLTITADVQTKVYGEIDPELTYVVAPALINGDVLTGTLSRVAGENVGTRAIEQGDLDNSNYDISFVSADLTITTKPITVTAVTNTKTYNGNMDAIATPTFPEGSLVGSDTANFIEAYDTKNVGTEKILTPSGVVDDGNGGDNYSYNFIADLTGAITQASLTATITVSNKVVDGNNSATITGRTLIGVIGDDIVTPNEDGVAIFEDAIIGNDKIVTATGITITGADVANYFYDGTATGTGNILPIPTVVFVDANWVGTENWIDPDGEGPATYFGYDAFATIQEAVSAVEEGGVVNVLVGIYTESIIINKTLSVVGVGSTTVIQPAIDTDGITITADGVVIKDVKVSTSNSSIPPDVTPNKAISVEEADNLEINNIIVETTGDGAMGIWIGGSNNGMDPVSGLTIIKSDITVNNEATGIYADHSTPAHSGWLVGGSAENANTVTVPLGNPIELYDVTDSEVSHNTITTSASGGSATIWSSELSDLSNLIFNDNAVSYSGGSQVAFLTDFISSLRGDIPPDTNVSNVTVSGNTFNDWGLRGLRIGDGVTSVIVSENKFLGTGEALKNEDVSGVNAEGNWWGSAVLSTVGSKINGTVDFDPYYVENGMSILSDIPVTVAYVDSTYTDGLENDSHYFGYDAFNTIQEGINAVEAGGTVNVADGNYAETIGTCDGDAAMFCIEKSLTITGDPGAQGETIDDAGPAGTPVIDGDGAFASAFVISSGVSNITIEGFEIHNFANDPALFTGGIGSAVLSWNSGATNITVQDNYLHDLGWNGVLVGSDDGTTQSGWTVKRNIIEGADYAGIELTNVTNSEVAFNDVTIGEGISWDPNDSGVGIEVAVRDHGTEVTAGANVSVHDNEITGDGVAPERAGINILSRAYQAASNA